MVVWNLAILWNVLSLFVYFVSLRGTARALAVDASSAHVYWQMASNCPHNQKALELCRSYAQNKAQKHHPQRIVVAVLKATLIVLQG